MAHRRKSSMPQCKQKRISSVVDRVLAAKLQENEKKKLFDSESVTSDETDRKYGYGSEDSESLSRKSDRKENVCSNGGNDDEADLDIPQDLMSEFKALKKATQMDTASLMRKMIKDYSMNSGSDKPNSGSRLTSQLFDVSIKSSDKDRNGSGFHERSRPTSPGEIIRSDIGKQRQYDAHARERVSKAVEVQRNPSPARTYSAEQYLWEEDAFNPQYNRDVQFSNGYRSSMKVPTVIRDSDSGSEGKSFSQGSRPLSRQNMYSPMGSEHSISTRNGIQELSGDFVYASKSPEQPSIQDPFVGGSHIVDHGGVSSAFPLVASLCDENGVIISPKHENGLIEKEIDIDQTKLNQEIISQTDAHLAMQALNPHGVTAKLQKASGKANSKKGQMKLIAENTSHHGVYTSVLKLPWSRRTRTPKNDPGKTQERAAKSEETHLMDKLTDLEQISPPQMAIKAEPMDEAPDSPPAPHVQQPMMLVPVSSIPASQSGIFVPASSMPMTMEQSSKPPMMMVYPNSSFANVGRPARKRGRPPKVPVLTRMLSDTSKVPKFDFPVTNFFPQFTPCPQPAIVLNVNNMMNTGNVGHATNNTNANVNTSTASNVVESNVNVNIQESETLKQDGGAMPTSSTSHEAMSLNVPIQATIYNMQEDQFTGKDTIKTEEKIGESVISKSAMTTTTSVANSRSGAIYQEMILSSKSLVTVKPRKRQSTTDMLKSKSTPKNEFICTSFKLRNVNKPEKEKKKTPWVPGMKRRGRPPKKKIFSMVEGQPELNIHHTQFLPATIHHFPTAECPITSQQPDIFSPVVSSIGQIATTQPSPKSFNYNEQPGNESETSDSTVCSGTFEETRGHTDDEKDENNKDMFQQLFHCKICNEVVPVDKQEEHREKHVQIKYCCNKCETTKVSYALRDDIEKDVSVDKLFKCLDCSSADDTPSDASSVSLVCMICNDRFVQFSSLSDHKLNAHNNENSATKEFSCAECNKQFVNYQKYKLHQQLCHETRYHACPFQNCQKIYTSPVKLQNHIQKRHENRLHLRCIYDGCTEKFYTHASLKEHIQKGHYSVKGYACSKPGCDEEFTSERDLKFHLLLHNDSDMYTFKCEICDYRCHQQSVLEWHMKNLHPETDMINGSGSVSNVD